jgi:hypothetical protein
MDNLPQLTITDLVTLQQTVEIACTRGAFRAEEMKKIGTVYEQLSAFLLALKAHVDTQTETQADTESSVEAVAPPQGD